MPRGTKSKEKDDDLGKKAKTTASTGTKSQPQKKELTREQQKDRIRKRLSDPAYLARTVPQEKLSHRLQV